MPWQGRFSASRLRIAARSSMRLLVVSGSPPDSSFSWAPDRMTAPQPPRPGLPLQAPSVKISTVESLPLMRRAMRWHWQSHKNPDGAGKRADPCALQAPRSEEHTSELQSLLRISSAVFCLKKKTKQHPTHHNKQHNYI